MSGNSCPDDDDEGEESCSESDTSDDSETEVTSNQSSDDEVVKTILRRQELKKTNPPDIKTDELITDICFSPKDDKLVVCYHNGNIDLHQISIDESDIIHSFESIHNNSCRGAEFTPDGKYVISVSSDGDIIQTNLDKMSKRIVNSDENNSFLNVKVLNQNNCVTGDEAGNLLLWDMRNQSYVDKAKVSEEGISYLHYSYESERIFCTSGDGVLSVYDLRGSKRLKLFNKSDAHSSELTSCCLVRSERNVICSTSEGELLIFQMDPFDYEPYKPTKSKLELSSVLTATENIVLAAYEDGRICAVHLFPNAYVGLIGNHNWYITKLDVSHDGSIIASAADSVKFWNISFLEEVDNYMAKGKKKSENPLPSSGILSRKEFFSDLKSDNEMNNSNSDDDADDDNDDDDDEGL